MTGSLEIRCAKCGKPALLSPSKGKWCGHCPRVTTDVRRYPRTLQEAFGPYTSNVIYEAPPPRMPWLGLYVSAVLALIGWVILR